jgi:phage shock protein PspC (stress-responsive transcriptional regulator)
MRSLTRSKTDKVIAGVCGGLGEYFNVDPVIIRLIFVVVTILGGAGVLAYIVMWIIVPESGQKSYAESIKKDIDDKKKDKDGKSETGEKISKEMKEVIAKRKNDGPYLIGAILILIGLIFLAQNFFSFISFEKLWPLILVVVGLGILLSSAEGR